MVDRRLKPNKFTTDIFFLSFNWTGEKAYANIEYYASLFRDAYHGISQENPFYGGTNGTPLAGGFQQNTMSTPPSNQLHQRSLSGGYFLSPETRLTGGLSTHLPPVDVSVTCNNFQGGRGKTRISRVCHYLTQKTLKCPPIHCPAPDGFACRRAHSQMPPMTADPLPEGDQAIPLVVDLDGTLIRTDMLQEALLCRLRAAPLSALRWPFWLLRGRAHLKQRLAEDWAFDPAVLPYNGPLLQWLRAQRQAGRRLVLCTASDQTQARIIAEHLGLFDEVMASDGTTNLRAEAKAAALVARFGAQGFDYAGNSTDDLTVWQQARRAIVVNASARVLRRARQQFDVQPVFERQRPGPRT
jgi:phosphoserine phosphatase